MVFRFFILKVCLYFESVVNDSGYIKNNIDNFYLNYSKYKERYSTHQNVSVAVMLWLKFCVQLCNTNTTEGILLKLHTCMLFQGTMSYRQGIFLVYSLFWI